MGEDADGDGYLVNIELSAFELHWSGNRAVAAFNQGMDQRASLYLHLADLRLEHLATLTESSDGERLFSYDSYGWPGYDIPRPHHGWARPIAVPELGTRPRHGRCARAGWPADDAGWFDGHRPSVPPPPPLSTARACRMAHRRPALSPRCRAKVKGRRYHWVMLHRTISRCHQLGRRQTHALPVV